MGPLFPNRELRLSVDRSPLVGDISRANQLEQCSKLIQGLIAIFCLRLYPRVVCVCVGCVWRVYVYVPKHWVFATLKQARRCAALRCTLALV